MEIAYREALQNVQGKVHAGGAVIPPNRLETRTWELLSSLVDFHPQDSLETLRESLRKLTGRQHVLFAPSCRSAIAQVLSMLPEREVVIPAFTCPVVKTAVELAGKRIIYVDAANHSVNSTCAEFEQEIVPGRVIIPTHLFGIPTNVESICELAKARGCVTIEDAAAGFGATYKGQPLGTFADVGIYSFERSKRVPAFRGAAIVINNETLIDPARLASHSLTHTTCGRPLGDLQFALVHNLATIPSLYGRVTVPRLLRRYLAEPHVSQDEAADSVLHSAFYNRQFHPVQARLVLRVLSRLKQVRKHIDDLVQIYEHSFLDTGIQQFTTEHTDRGGMLRFPVAFVRRCRSDVLRHALRHHLFLETNYEQPLPERSTWNRFPNTLWAAEHLVLLPLYSSLSLPAAEQIASILNNIDAETPSQL